MDASTPPQVATPLLQLRGIDKRFVQPMDLAGRIANLLGARNAPSVVHAVAGVALVTALMGRRRTGLMGGRRSGILR